MDVSVIIRAYNEERHIADLLAALRRQTLADFETIVVDSGSVDATRDIAEGAGAKVLRISSQDFTFGYSLNVGIGAARGRAVAIISAHAVPGDAHWLARLVAPLGDPDTAMVYGRQLGVRSSKFSEVEDFRRTFGTERSVLKPPRWFANNANACVCRDLWAQHAFDERLTGLEDIEWAKYWMERGYRIVYEPAAAIYHVHEENWRQIRHRYYREALAAREIGVKGRADILRETVRELNYAVNDLARAFAPKANPAAERLSLPRRAGEIALFRINKLAGSIQGLGERNRPDLQSRLRDILFERQGRAVVIEAPGKATLATLAVPDLKPGDALIRVAHVAVCATDIEILNGTLGYFQKGLAHYPQVPGHEFSGRVVAVGQNVTRIAEGDVVVAECIQSCGVCGDCRAGNFIGCDERTELGVFRRHGAYADYVVVPARFIHKVPEGTDLAAAALVEPMAVVLKGLRRALPLLHGMVPARVPVGVVGAGPLGHLGARILAHRGFPVRAFDRSAARLQKFASSAIEISTDLNLLKDCRLIVEVTGNPAALDAVLANSPAGATILLLGLPYGERSFSFENIVAYDKLVVGSVGSTSEDFAAAIELLPSIVVDPLLRCRLPLAEFDKGWQMSKREDILKVILDVAPGLAAT